MYLQVKMEEKSTKNIFVDKENNKQPTADMLRRYSDNAHVVMSFPHTVNKQSRHRVCI